MFQNTHLSSLDRLAHHSAAFPIVMVGNQVAEYEVKAAEELAATAARRSNIPAVGTIAIARL
jgi:hypothetical protein